MNEKWIELIEAYLAGDMSPDEKLAFEADLKANHELSESYSIYRAIGKRMLANEEYRDMEAAFLQSLKKLGAIHFNDSGINSQKDPATPVKVTPGISENHIAKKSSNHVSTRWWKLALAASVAGAVITGATWYFQKEKSSGQLAGVQKKTGKQSGSLKNDTATYNDSAKQGIANNDTGINEPGSKKNNSAALAKQQVLFAKNFVPDKAPSNHTTALQEAFELYENKKYQSAIAAIEDAGIGEETRGQAEDSLIVFYAGYYKALSYLATGRTSRAISTLNVIKGPNAVFQTKVKWYLALAHLKSGNVNRAEALLNMIAKGGRSEYKSKAAVLVKELHP